MSSGFATLAFVCFLLVLVQALAALPWLHVFTRRPLRSYIGILGGVTAASFVGFLYAVNQYSDPAVLARTGRLYTSVLQLQLTLDVFVLAFWLMLTAWPKGGAVALAAFQEG